MNFDELEETLAEFLPPNFSIEKNRKGELVIRTNLRQDDEGELIDMDEEDFDEDLVFDDETEPLGDEDEVD